MPPSVRLKGDKTEAANWIRRGKVELQRLKDVAANADVPVTNRTIEFNDRVTCNVSIWGGVEIIEIHAIPLGVQEEEPSEEEVVEEDFYYCQPGFMVYRDYNGYKWNPDAEPPAWEPVRDAGELLTWDGGWKKVDTEYKRGANQGWYHLKDIIGTLNRKTEYRKCSVVTWYGPPWGTGGWPSQAVDAGGFFFQGQFYLVNTSVHVFGVCILPGLGSDAGTDYFYALVGHNYAYDSVIVSFWCCDSYSLRRAPVKLPPDENSTLDWEVIKTWDELDPVNPLLEWSHATAPPGLPHNTSSAPVMGAYIDKKGIAHMGVARWYGQQAAQEPVAGSTVTTNGVYVGDYYGSPLPRIVAAWNDQRIHTYMNHGMVSFQLNMRTGAIQNVVDESYKGVRDFSHNYSGVSENYPVLGLGVLPSSYVYCGPPGGSGSEQSDLVNFNLPDDQRNLSWLKQGHHGRGDPKKEAHRTSTLSGGTTCIGVFGGCDAHYTAHYVTTPYSFQESMKGGSEKKKATNPDPGEYGFDALPLWSWWNLGGGSINAMNVDFECRRNGGAHFNLGLYRSNTQSSGPRGSKLTGTSYTKELISASAPWSDGRNWPNSSFTGTRNTATSTGYQRLILFYHPMINKALFFERQFNTFYSGEQYSIPWTSAVVYLKWGSGDDAITLGSWSGSTDGGAESLYNSMAGFGDAMGAGGFIDVDCLGGANPGPTIEAGMISQNFRYGLWAGERIAGAGTAYSPRYAFTYNEHDYWCTQGGLSPRGAYFAPMANHRIYRENSNTGTSKSWYDRVTWAVHDKSLVSGGQPPYILYIPKITFREGEDPASLVVAPLEIFEYDYNDMWVWNDGFDPENADGWFFSNCMTLSQLKRLAGRDSDYPLDFGVV